MRFLIVYGPTREPIDPVRYISNYSTGTMGRYLVEAARKRRHAVESIVCPEETETALELLSQMKKKVPRCQVLIMAAAVCDARPLTVSKSKIKKEKLSAIHLQKNPDLLENLAPMKKKGQKFVGFGLESGSVLENGAQKLQRKRLDLIVIQKVIKNKTPFGDKAIDAWFLRADGQARALRQMPKKRLAEQIILEAERLPEIA